MSDPLNAPIPLDTLDPDPSVELLAVPVTFQDPLTGYTLTVTLDIEKYNLLAMGYIDTSDPAGTDWL